MSPLLALVVVLALLSIALCVALMICLSELQQEKRRLAHLIQGLKTLLARSKQQGLEISQTMDQPHLPQRTQEALEHHLSEQHKGLAQ